jgi:glycine cleavage system aminomethyltransferase T
VRSSNTMKLSALHRSHQRAGAIFADIESWQVPDVFATAESEVSQVRHSVGIADLSHRIKFDSPSRLGDNSWQLGPRHYLTIFDPPMDLPPDAVDVTGAYADFLVAGCTARAVLSKLSSLNVQEDTLPNLTCGQTNVAHSHAIILREDLGTIPAFHLLIGREYAESAWESILHAGHEFRIAPFGLQALARLRS